MGETKRREETNEAGWPTGDPPGGLSRSPEDVTLPAEKQKSTLREYAETFAIAIVFALLIRTFVVQAFKIPSGSMIPTLAIGDHILVSKFIYGIRLPFTDITLIPIRTPRRGDVIVFRYPEDESKDFIKRTIGIPGDTIEIKNKVLYVNGQPQHETYINMNDRKATPFIVQTHDNYGPIRVPEHSYFVMGDNRNHSLDSRFWGFVDYSQLKGKAFIIYLSLDSEAGWADWIRFDRFGKIIY